MRELAYIREFVWDSAKGLADLAKHGVSFEEASTVFADMKALDADDIAHSSPSESRNQRLGISGSGRVLLVVYTIRRLPDGQEAIRIISARRASRKEKAAYSRFRDRFL
ncbi:MAG TPA: BrnT family toxin [Candidatus Binatia bacterium]